MEETQTPVTLIESRGESVVVEYAGGMKRVIIPLGQVQEGKVSADILEMGVPYGLPWEDLIKLEATPERLASELRMRGIWTIDDMRINQSAVFGAIQATYGLDLAALIMAAETYEKGR